MAIADFSRPMTGQPVLRFVADALGRVASWNDARLTRKALSKLTDRELDDIGLTFADIDRIARA